MSERPPTDTAAPLRVAVVGCGAVTEKRYLPAAAMVSGVAITHAVDLDGDRAASVAEAFGVPHVASDLESVLPEVDAVVVATPPESHHDLTVRCLEAGRHVLCEKPLAPSLAEARSMVRAAGASGAILSVAMVRRQGRSARLLRRCVGLGMAGRLERVDIEEGGEFGWPLRTGHIFESDQGGVLRDTGSHLLDLALWIVGADGASVTGYEDDSWGGPEANASIELELRTPDGPVAAAIEVSFTRSLSGRIRVAGSSGILEGNTLGGIDVTFVPAEEGAPTIRLDPEDGEEQSRVQDFASQLEEFAVAVRRGGPPPVPAASVVPTLAVIEACHASRSRTVRPWEAPPSPDSTRASAAAREVARG